MLMLITYDISFDDPNGRARLRRIAKHCLDYGVRAQYSVFECDVNARPVGHIEKQTVGNLRSHM